MAAPIFTLDWVGWRNPQGQFSARKDAEVEPMLVEVRDKALRIAREETPIAAPGNTPPGQEPGNLRRRWACPLHAHGGSGSLELFNTARYYRWVVGGRAPIVAAPGRRLRFFYKGRWLFRRSVRGVAPNPFDQRIVARIQGEVGHEELRRHTGRLITAFDTHLG